MKNFLQSLVLVFITNGIAQTLELNPATSSLISPNNFIEYNSKMHFFARNASFQYCLYNTDGTATSNQLIKVLSSFPTTPVPINTAYEDNKIVFNNKLYFSGDAGFYQSDGTTAGTVIFGLGVVRFAKYFKIFNNRLYFLGYDDANGYEIWSTDGTVAGTTMIKDIFMGTTGSLNPINDPHFTQFNNNLFFVANDGVTGWELWSTDGTETGTSLFKDLRTNEPGYDGFGAFQISGNYSNLPFKVVNNKMYFAACPYAYANATDDYLGLSEYVLYETNGTVAGTRYVAVPPPSGAVYNYSYLYNLKGLTADSNQLFVFGTQAFTPGSSALAGGVFKIDNANPVVKLKYFSSNSGDSGTSEQTQKREMKFFNGEYYFLGSDITNSPNDLALWKINPVTYDFTKIAGPYTGTIKDFDETKYLTTSVFNNKLYFLKSNAGSVFSTDGTIAGTTFVARNSANNSNNSSTSATSILNLTSQPEQFKLFNNSLYFKAQFNSSQTIALWRLNGSSLSISENAVSNFKIYPNPASNNLNLSFPNGLNQAIIKIISITGQNIFEKNNFSGLDFKVDVSELTSGIYLIQVIDGEKVMKSKFIKQ